MIALLPMVAGFSACSLIAPPSAHVRDVRFTELGLSAARLEVGVGVHNPMFVDLHVQAMRWHFDVGAITVAKGATSEPTILPASSTTTVPVPVELRYRDVSEAISAGMAAEQVPYEVALELDTITPTGEVTVPVVHRGTLPRLRAPELDLISLDWDVEADGRLRFDVALHLSLPEGFSASRLDWSVSVDGRALGQGSVMSQPDGTLRFPMFLDPRGAAEASWAWMWGEAHRFEVAVDGQIVTPLGTVPLRAQRAIALQEHGTPPG